MVNNKATKETPIKCADRQPVRVFSERKMAAQRNNVNMVVKRNNTTFKPL